MKSILKLFNTSESFKAARVTNYLFPVSEKEQKKLQSTLLEIYIDILSFCKNYRITPFLVGGSALGAVRHHGFIPWDDDLDVGMIRSQYDRFVYEFEKQYGDKYIVNSAGKDKNAKCRFTKVIKKGTLCKELFSPSDDSINGIFIDVFPIDNVPDNKIVRTIKGYYCNVIEYIAGQVFYFEFSNEKEKEILKNMGTVNYLFRKTVSIIFGYRNAAGWYSKLNKAEQYHNNRTKYCSIVPGRKHYFGEIIDRKIIFPAKYIDFNGIKAPVFQNIKSYLINLYGDNYMELPPVEKREKHMLKKLDFGKEK